MAKKVLVVEDDSNIAELLRLYLEKDGFDVFLAADGGAGIRRAQELQPDLILLDIMLPVVDGWVVCSEVRKTSNVPIIMLTAKGEPFDKISGLEMGADDYVTKPFSPAELIARVKSQLRRYMTLGDYANRSGGSDVALGGLLLHRDQRQLDVDGEPVKLTPKEYRIVELLMSNPGRVFSAEEIYERVWNETAYSVENTIMVHIRRIREKIEINPNEPRYLKVVWGIGYKMEKIQPQRGL